MGKETKKILGPNLNMVITELNKALADEFLASYQYWVGSKIVKGILRKEVEEELIEHSKDEHKHAEMLTTRILQLDGTPILEPKDWYKLTSCGYLKPRDFSSLAILNQNLDGERCAIKIYNKLLKNLKNKDDTTFFIIESILNDEIEHESDLENLIEDITSIIKS